MNNFDERRVVSLGSSIRVCHVPDHISFYHTRSPSIVVFLQAAHNDWSWHDCCLGWAPSENTIQRIVDHILMVRTILRLQIVTYNQDKIQNSRGMLNQVLFLFPERRASYFGTYLDRPRQLLGSPSYQKQSR